MDSELQGRRILVREDREKVATAAMNIEKIMEKLCM